MDETYNKESNKTFNKTFIYFIIILILKLGGLIMEKLLWLDGHVSYISDTEVFQKSYVEPKEDGYVEVLSYNGFEFEWHNDMWMQR